ncbi:MAG: DUF5721 family protein [Defluviitaleaceae bacterium]|nr:DUF5721 family protein [Defluviitaleaceae bacterium]
MISLAIEDKKNFMKKLFKENIFDNFFVTYIEIVNFANFEIKTKQNPQSWQILKPYAYNIIKGNETPKSMKIIFTLSEEISNKINPDYEFFLNLYFQNELYFTTGTSPKKFTLDKSINYIWEDYVKNFMNKNLIQYISIE